MSIVIAYQLVLCHLLLCLVGVFRAELLDLPFEIELADVGAWVVHYPLDAEGNTTALSELTVLAPRESMAGGEAKAASNTTPPPGTPSVPYGDSDTITVFDSSDGKLNAVWELGRWTILTTSLDVKPTRTRGSVTTA